MARPQFADRGDGLEIWRIAANIFNKQSRTASGVVLQLGGSVQGLTTPHHKKETVTKPLDKPRNWTDSLERPRQTNKGMRLRE